MSSIPSYEEGKALAQKIRFMSGPRVSKKYETKGQVNYVCCFPSRRVIRIEAKEGIDKERGISFCIEIPFEAVIDLVDLVVKATKPDKG